VLPFGRFPGADVLLGPEMRSTGEVMSFGASFPEAFAKAQIAAGNPLPVKGTALISLADRDKRQGTALVSQLRDLGFDLVATSGTARVLRAMGIPAQSVKKIGEGRPNVVDLISQGTISLVVNTPSGHGNEVPAPIASSSLAGARPDAFVPAGAKRRGIALHLEGKRTVGYRIRTAALNYRIPYVTTLVSLRATVAAVRALKGADLPTRELSEIQTGRV
jgi:carbamoyl-phosphate synthase large subunit